MNLTISGHHLDVSPSLREYVLTKLDRVTRHFDQVVDINVLLSVEKLKEKDVESLVDYRSRSQHGVRAHPTDEHFLPLFFALGAAAEKAKPQRVYDAIDSGVLAMDAYVFG